MTEPQLRADCSRCTGLCCVALPFTRSTDFAFDKPAGEPCLHLQPDFRCGIHTDLAAHGFRGCASFDCFGAGQYVSQELFPGAQWRSEPAVAAQLFSAFAIVRQLHEMLWYLRQADRYATSPELRDAVATAVAETRSLTDRSASAADTIDVPAHRALVSEVLRRVSREVRATATDLAGTDLAGRDLRSIDLCDADLRGAVLLAADLRGADLHHADLLGADLRDANVRGAQLHDALYLSQTRLNASYGDALTTVPAELHRPAHWPAASQT